jgi:hypothetical protein
VPFLYVVKLRPRYVKKKKKKKEAKAAFGYCRKIKMCFLPQSKQHGSGILSFEGVFIYIFCRKIKMCFLLHGKQRGSDILSVDFFIYLFK